MAMNNQMIQETTKLQLNQQQLKDDEKKKFEESSDFANYFCTYGFLYHQKQMLEDDSRMYSYYSAIMENKDCFNDKVILDVGTGSGILSIWAAKAGAKKVYAIEATNMAIHARKLIKANGQDHIITVIQSKMEDVKLPEKVDIIISEWMGYFLLRESMLDSVLDARDKWLKPDGAMYPSHATISLALLHDDGTGRGQHVKFTNAMQEWSTFTQHMKSEWDVDMSCLNHEYHKEHEDYFLNAASFAECKSDQVASNDCCIKTIDILKDNLEDIKTISSSFSLKASDVCSVGDIVGWFDVDFRGSPEHPTKVPVSLSTSPFAEITHWGQQVFPIYPPLQLCQNDTIEGKVEIVRQKDNQRLLNVQFKYQVNQEDKSNPLVTATYHIE